MPGPHHPTGIILILLEAKFRTIAATAHFVRTLYAQSLCKDKHACSRFRRMLSFLLLADELWIVPASSTLFVEAGIVVALLGLIS